MTGLNLQAMGDNPILKMVNDLTAGRNDAAALVFDHRVLGTDPKVDDQFRGQLRFVRELFNEALAAIESVTARPTNPIVSPLFYNWIDSFDIDPIRRMIEAFGVANSHKTPPQYIHIHCELRKVVQPQDAAFEMEIRVSLVYKNEQGVPKVMYPCSSTVFVLTKYEGRF